MYYVCFDHNFFIGDRYKDVGEIWRTGIIKECDNLIFFDSEDVEYFIENNKDNDITVFISLVSCGTENQFKKLFEMQNAGIKFEEITLSADMVYKALDYPKLWLGSEKWNKGNDHSGRLDPLDFRVTKEGICAFNVGTARKLLDKVDEIINWIESWNPSNDLEKVLLLDAWMQKTIQYIKDKESEAGKEIYECPDMSRSSITEDVLMNHFGVCSDIAFSAALILNNPRVNIRCRQVGAYDHSWNIIMLDNKEYYMDFTHNITRNPYRLSDALMAAGYCYKYTLLGKKEAMEEYGGPFEYPADSLSEESYDRDIIQRHLEKLSEKGLELKWVPQLVKPQKKR